jgi:hypothetical protein
MLKVLVILQRAAWISDGTDSSSFKSFSVPDKRYQPVDAPVPEQPLSGLIRNKPKDVAFIPPRPPSALPLARPLTPSSPLRMLSAGLDLICDIDPSCSFHPSVLTSSSYSISYSLIMLFCSF